MNAHRPERTRRIRPALLGAAALAAFLGACDSRPDPTPPLLEYIQVEVADPSGTSEATLAVYVDGRSRGTTAELIELEGGQCVVTLEDAEKFEPGKHEVTIEGTSALTPLVLSFSRK